MLFRHTEDVSDELNDLKSIQERRRVGRSRLKFTVSHQKDKKDILQHTSTMPSRFIPFQRVGEMQKLYVREKGVLASVYTAEENDELSKILGYQRETVYAIDFSTSGFHNQKGNSITYACQRYDDAFCIESPPLLFHS